jgi:hypothetical protein
MTQVLTRRLLNRATLARQHLLQRVDARALDTIEHLAGMQSQAPLAPYVGLWTRLQDFDPRELTDLTANRRVVRLHLMRNTVHLVSARDALAWRALFSSVLAAEYGAHFRGGIDRVDLDGLLEEATRLLEERPRTRAELGRILAERWPDAEPSALAYAASHHLALCQVPPRGLWGRGGPAAWAPVERWLGAPLADGSVGDLVLRYLGAFGPATVADVQQWSGLTRLREVVERLPLQRFGGETGETFYDLPEAPRPDRDTPAPPRFLPAYDNLLLSYKDRARVIPDSRPVPLPPGDGATVGTFLVDGRWQGTWQVRDRTLRIEAFGRLRPAEREAVLAEAASLCSFLGADTSCDVVLTGR